MRNMIADIVRGHEDDLAAGQPEHGPVRVPLAGRVVENPRFPGFIDVMIAAAALPGPADSAKS